MKKLKSLGITLGILIALTSCKKTEDIDTPAKEVASYEITEQDKVQESNIVSTIMTYKATECGDEYCYTYFTDEKGKEISVGIPDDCEYEFEPCPGGFGNDCGNYLNAKFKITYDLTKDSNEVINALSIKLLEEISNKANQQNSSKKSFTEIRSLIISGNKNNMIRQLGEPNEEYSAYDFLKKYYDWKPISVYTSERPLGISIFVYDNIDNTNNTILVIYNFNKRQVTDIIYKSDVKSFEDVCVH
jgi:hypothetical protein